MKSSNKNNDNNSNDNDEQNDRLKKEKTGQVYTQKKKITKSYKHYTENNLK